MLSLPPFISIEIRQNYFCNCESLKIKRTIILKNNSHFAKFISLGRHLWGINHSFHTVTFEVWRFVTLSSEHKNPFSSCILIAQGGDNPYIEGIYQFQKDAQLFGSIKKKNGFPFSPLGWPRKGKQLNSVFANCGFVYCLPYTMYFILLFIKYKDHVHVYIK